MEKDGRRVFRPLSAGFFQDQMRRLPVGKKLTATFSEDVWTRSRSQLSLFMVYAEYAAEASGFTKDEMYEILIKECFGVEKREFRGRTYEVRRSVSDAAKMSTADMGLLIEHAKAACDFLGCNVPSAESLGYLPSH